MISAVNQTLPPQVDGPAVDPPATPCPGSARQRIGHWLRVDAARLLWPNRCLACEAPGLEGVDLCGACAGALPWNRYACPDCALPLPAPAVCGDCLRRAAVLARRRRSPALDGVHAAFVYASPLDRLLPRFKFHRDFAAGALLAQLMAESAGGWPRPEALVPIPLHRTRLRQRGYDQALELARPLARALELPVRDDLLHRLRFTAPQSELSAAGRLRNLRGAFAARATASLPAHVALVDDVMTTGATLSAAADALKRLGVRHVDAWVCARVP